MITEVTVDGTKHSQVEDPHTAIDLLSRWCIYIYTRMIYILYIIYTYTYIHIHIHIHYTNILNIYVCIYISISFGSTPHLTVTTRIIAFLGPGNPNLNYTFTVMLTDDTNFTRGPLKKREPFDQVFRDIFVGKRLEQKHINPLQSDPSHQQETKIHQKHSLNIGIFWLKQKQPIPGDSSRDLNKSPGGHDSPFKRVTDHHPKKVTSRIARNFSTFFHGISIGFPCATRQRGQATAEIHLCRGDTEPALRLLQEVRPEVSTNVHPIKRRYLPYQL